MEPTTPQRTNDADAPWTVRRLLDWTTDYFRKSDPEQPRLRAEILLGEAMGCRRIDLYTRFDEVPDADVLGRFREWVKRHARGEPVAYLVGYQEFYSLRFRVSPDVLIPRPETEHVAMRAIDLARAMPNDEFRICDAGTGSGCLAIVLAAQIRNSLVWATDISGAALDVARDNVVLHNLTDRVSLCEGDLLQPVTDLAPFDLIVSNPPYVGTEEQGTLQESVRQYEPHSALFAGPGGTDVIRRLAAQAPGHLRPGGYLVFEISPLIETACRTIIDQTPDLEWISTDRDFASQPRVITARRSD